MFLLQSFLQDRPFWIWTVHFEFAQSTFIRTIFFFENQKFFRNCSQWSMPSTHSRIWSNLLLSGIPRRISMYLQVTFQYFELFQRFFFKLLQIETRPLIGGRIRMYFSCQRGYKLGYQGRSVRCTCNSKTGCMWNRPPQICVQEG